jgi:hypothetical protein
MTYKIQIAFCVVNALALCSEPGQGVTARFLGLLGESQRVAGRGNILLLHELDLVLAIQALAKNSAREQPMVIRSPHILFLLLFRRELSVVVRRATAVATVLSICSTLSIPAALARNT